MENKSYYKSPIGIIEIITKDDYLISLKFVQNYIEIKNDTPFIKNIKTQLDEYFNKERRKFNIKIKLSGTPFQMRVWNELLKIPYGKLKTYKDVATLIGDKNSSRAVGVACGKNQIALVVPCHRVIGSNGKLTGFAFGIEKKQKLIDLEKD